MYGEEAAFRNTAEQASSASMVMCAVSLATGLFFTNSLCDMDLAEWNLVNAALCGMLAASANLALKGSPGALQNGFRLSKGEFVGREILNEGVVAAAVAIGIAGLPMLLLLWSIRGFCSMGVGICAESAPLFFGISLCEIMVQGAATAYVACQNLRAAGYDMERVKQISYRAKDTAVCYAGRAVDNAVPATKAALNWAIETSFKLWDSRPKILTSAYWAGSEGSYLLR